MRTASLACLVVLGVVARDARATDGGSEARTSTSPVMVSLQRTVCYGECPAYNLAVREDGTVEYEGIGFVKVIGPATDHLTASELEALRKAFWDAKFLSMHGRYDCREATDNPYATLYFRDGNFTNTTHHYFGCRSTPGLEALTKLERRVDELVRVQRWVGR